MTITLLQQDTIAFTPETNIAKISAAIDRNPGSDIYVLPEMFNTGFLLNPIGQAEAAAAPTLEWMKQKAREANAAICGSMAVEEKQPIVGEEKQSTNTGEAGKSRYFNRFCFVTPDGEVHHYDKSHLYAYGGEDKIYTPGRERTIIEFRGVRILLLVCYDLFFPTWARNDIAPDGNALFDLIIYSSNWPDVRRLSWDVLLAARAIENQTYVAAANRVGEDPLGHYFGGSKLIHPFGHVLAECPTDSECEATAILDLPSLRHYRQKYPSHPDIVINRL